MHADQYARFKSQMNKKKQAAIRRKDIWKINNRFLSKQEITTKTAKLQKELKLKRKHLKTLKERIQKYVKGNSVNVDPELSRDFGRIFQENHCQLSEVQKIFFSEQLKALSRQKNPRTMRWNPFFIKVALHLQSLSRSAYKYLKNFIVLPSERTLYDYTHFVDGKVGPQDVIMEEISQKQTNRKYEHEDYFNLMFDEMHIKSDIVMSKKTGEVIGYTHLSKVEEELAQLEADMVSQSQFKPQPAKKVLVYLVQGITNDVKEVVGIYPTSDLSASQLFTRTWYITYLLEGYGLKVLCFICDGASTNKKFFRMHKSLDPQKSFIYITQNIACGENRPVFFIVDPPHVLKTLRNCLANSYAHKKSRKLWKNKEDMSWKAFEVLYEKTLADKFRKHKLTRAHVKLTSFSCMKVLFASQVMSKSVANEFNRLKTDRRFKNFQLNELIKLLNHVNDFFDCLNGSDDPKGKRNKENPLLLTYTSCEDERFKYLKEDMLGFFQQWENDVLHRRGSFSKAAREKMCVSQQSLESLKISTFGFIGAVKFMLSKGAPALEARKFNQDKLEQYFGLIRMSGGGKNNPTVADFVQKSLSLHVQGSAAQPALKGNTEVQQGKWIPDESPIPKRRRKE